VRTLQCNKKYLFFYFLPMKNWKNHPKKLLRIGPDPFFPQSSPGISPRPNMDFPYYEISGPDICSLICVVHSETIYLIHFNVRHPVHKVSNESASWKTLDIQYFCMQINLHYHNWISKVILMITIFNLEKFGNTFWDYLTFNVEFGSHAHWTFVISCP
jgi:hypothetical protein